MCELAHEESQCPILAVVAEQEVTFFVSLEADSDDESSSQLLGEPRAYSGSPWVKVSVVNAATLSAKTIGMSTSPSNTSTSPAKR